jgi:biopolymer transport protein ExbB
MRAIRHVLLALACLAIVPATAQEPANPDELLNLVEQGKAREARENQERLERFRRERAQQAEMLDDVKAARARLERRSEELESRFEENELEIANRREALNERLGSLKELFGVIQQVAGDTRGHLESSMVSAEIPGRESFLAELAQKTGESSKLATIEEMERLWYELQREMVETGKISRFEVPVIGSDGREESRQVVRVGAFNLVSRDEYLKFEPATGKVTTLARQPASRFRNSAERMSEAEEGSVTFGLDPTRGQILAALVRAPNLRERIDQGGLIGYLIIGLGVVALLIALERLVSLGIVGRKVNRQLREEEPSDDNPLGRVLQTYERNKRLDLENLELKLGEAILKETPRLTRAQMFLKIIAVVAPLMGLLGTVTGMIITFQSITLFGTGDPKLMAGGISQALVTTVLGLSVAIPTVLLHTMVSSRSKRIIHILQEQSAGIIADRTED